MTLISEREWGGSPDDPTSMEQGRTLGLIGRRLRANYQDLMDAPMPERLAGLVRQLEERLNCGGASQSETRSSSVMAID